MKCEIDINRLILFSEAIYKNGIFWTILDAFNGVVGIDLSTGKILEFISLKTRKRLPYDRMVAIFYHNRNLYYLFELENRIVKIEQDTLKVDYLLLPEQVGGVQEAIFYEGCLCLFISDKKKILVINIDDLTIKMCIELGDKRVLKGKEKWSLFWKPTICNGLIYVSCQSTNSFLVIDVKNGMWKEIEQEDMLDGIQDIYVTESQIYILGVNGSIKRIDGISENGSIVCLPEKKHGLYSRIIYMNKKIWLLPAYGNSICCIDEGGEKKLVYSFADQINERLYPLKTKTKTSSYYIVKEYIYVFPRILNCMIIINTVTQECKKMDLSFTEKTKQKLKTAGGFNFWNEGISNIYNFSLSLEDYIDFIVRA